MDLDRHLVRPITEETGTRAAFGMVVGTLAGAAIAAMWCRIAPASCGCRIQEGCR